MTALPGGRRSGLLPALAVLALASTLASCSSSTTAGVKASPSAASATPSVAAVGPVSPALPGRVVFRRYLDSTKTTGALFISNTDGSGEHQVLTPPTGALDGEPDWSPDGSRLLFTRVSNVDSFHEAHALFTVSSAGGKATALTAGKPSYVENVPGFDEAGSYSPDGTRIAYVHSESNPTQALQQSNIFVMDTNGKQVRPVTRFPDSAGDLGGVQWSPDGKQLVFSRLNSDTSKPAGGLALFVIGADGTGLRRLTPWTLGAGGVPDWSRAGLIVFRAVQDEESGIGNFYTIHPDGTGVHQVTHFTDETISHKVGFSPDGKWIVFGKYVDGGSADVFLCKIDGTELHPVTRTPLEDSSPDWTASTS